MTCKFKRFLKVPTKRKSFLMSSWMSCMLYLLSLVWNTFFTGPCKFQILRTCLFVLGHADFKQFPKAAKLRMFKKFQRIQKNTFFWILKITELAAGQTVVKISKNAQGPKVDKVQIQFDHSNTRKAHGRKTKAYWKKLAYQIIYYWILLIHIQFRNSKVWEVRSGLVVWLEES